MIKRNKLRIGSILRGDSAYEGPHRVSRHGGLVLSDAHGALAEPTSRGKKWSVTTALAGTTIVTNNVAAPAAGVATVLSILNPVGSGVNLEIVRGWVAAISGKPAAGAWAWCGAQADVSITAAPNTPAEGSGSLSYAASTVKHWTQTALTGGPAHSLVRLFPMSGFAGAFDATPDQQIYTDNVDGAIVVPPGGLLTLAPPGVDGVTPLIAAAGIAWVEVALPLRGC